MKRWHASLLALLASARASAAPGLEASLSRVEARMQGRLGVFAVRGDATLGHRAGERFAYCSTFKWVLGAAVLKKVEEGSLKLDQPVRYAEKDLIPFSPVTTARVREGHLAIGELCAATMATSDNAAANLLEPRVGGLEGMRAFVQGLGDPIMRFDRMEPELNGNEPGDPRDTTSPEAMARLLRAALESEVLGKASKDQLLRWMSGVATGEARIPAGVPRGWAVAHKTGTGDHGAVNDVAVISPPRGGRPIYLCVFTDGSRTDTATHEAAIAEATRLVLGFLADAE